MFPKCPRGIELQVNSLSTAFLGVVSEDWRNT